MDRFGDSAAVLISFLLGLWLTTMIHASLEAEPVCNGQSCGETASSSPTSGRSKGSDLDTNETFLMLVWFLSLFIFPFVQLIVQAVSRIYCFFYKQPTEISMIKDIVPFTSAFLIFVRTPDALTLFNLIAGQLHHILGRNSTDNIDRTFNYIITQILNSSPVVFNPQGSNPLDDIMGSVDFESINASFSGSTLNKIMRFLVSRVLVSTLGLNWSFRAFELSEEELDAGMRTNDIPTGADIAKFAKCFLEFAYTCYNGTPEWSKLSDNNGYPQFHKEYCELMNNGQTMSPAKKILLVKSLLARAQKIARLQPIYLTYVQKLATMKDKMICVERAQRPRQAPLAVLVTGTPGIGKSTLLEHITRLFCHASDGRVIDDPLNRYTLNCGAKYWDGYVSQQIVTLDDMGALKPGMGNVDGGVSNLIQLVNDVTFVPDQAALEDKGVYPFVGELVLCTSNLEDAGLSSYFTRPAAAKRRLGIRIKVTPVPEYCVPGTTTLRPDLSEDQSLNVWYLRVEQAQVIGSVTQHVLVAEGTFAEMQPVLFSLFEAHFKKQKFSRERKDFINSLEFCPHNRYVSLCKECSGSEEPTEDPDLQSEPSQELLETKETLRQQLAELTERFDGLHNFFERQRHAFKSIPVPYHAEDRHRAVSECSSCGYTPDDDDIMEPQGFLPFISKYYRFYTVLARFVTFTKFTFIGSYLLASRIIFNVQLRASEVAMSFYEKAGLEMREPTDFEKERCYRFMFIGQLYQAIERHWAACKIYQWAEWGDIPMDEIYKVEKILKDSLTQKSPQHHVLWTWVVRATFAGSIFYGGKTLYDKYTSQRVDATPQGIAKTSFPVMQEKQSTWISDNIQAPKPTVTSKTVEFNSVKRVFRDSLVRIFGVVRMNATPVGGHWYATAAHFFHRIGKQGPYTFSYQTPSMSEPAEVTIDQVTFREDRDLAFFHMDTHHRSKLYLRKLFLEGPVQRMIGTPETLAMVTMNSELEVSVKEIKNLDSVSTYQAGHKDGIAIQKGFSYNTETTNGMCGSPIIAKIGSATIVVGIHVAGKGTTARGAQILPSDFSSFILDDQGEEDCATPFLVTHRPLDPLHQNSIFRGIEGPFVAYGSINRRIKFKHTVRRTLLADLAISKGIPVTHGGPVAKRETWSRPATKMATRINIPTCVLSDAVSSFLQQVPEVVPDLGPVDMVTAINGSPGVRFVDSVNMSTSVGYPYCRPKSDFLPFMEDPPEGLPNARMLPPLFQEEFDFIEESYSRGERVFPIFHASLKDEPVSLAKIEAHKVRIFAGCPFSWGLVMRTYLLRFTRFFQLNSLSFENAVGVDARSPKWGSFRDFVCTFGEDFIVAGDYSGFDKSMPAEVILAAFDFIIGVLKLAPDWDPDVEIIISTLAQDVAYPVYNFNGDIVAFLGSNPSGHPLTVVINCIVNSIYIRIAFFDITGSLDGFRDQVKLVTYGDDMIAGVDPASGVDHTNISVALGCRGIVFTMADKESESVPFLNIEKVDFLKRSFRVVHGYCFAPLDIQSINRSLIVSCMSSAITPEEHIASIIASALDNLFPWGPVKYLEYVALFEEFSETFPYDLRIATYEEKLKGYLSEGWISQQQFQLLITDYREALLSVFLKKE